MGSDSEREPIEKKTPGNDSPSREQSNNDDKKKSKESKSKRRHSRSRSRSSDRERRREKRKKRRSSKEYEILPRYYGEKKSDKRKENSDKYWTKYPKKDDNVVGKRYYDSSEETEPIKEKDSEKRNEDKADKSVIKPRERKTVDLLTSRTGGAYIPPAKLRMMQAEITDKSSAAFQRIAWEALKKSIHGYINKVNTANIGIIARELLHENIIRGRGLLCKSIIQAQAASPTFTNVYAALVAVINSKFPNIGELLLKRLVLQFKRGFKQNNKAICISAATFVAHLVNQSVAHEILALEILTLLIESPTDDSIEVSIAFLKECGQKLSEVSSRGINAIFEMLRNILHEGKLEKRIQYMIEVMYQIRKDGFKDHAAIIEELDIVEEDDQFTHLIKLDDVKQADAEEILNVFKFDEEYELNEGKYKILSKEILQSDSESGSESGSGDSDSDESGSEDEEKKTDAAIIDNTETSLIALRRTIYLTIQSSLDFEECAHKLLKMELKPGQEIELCHMFLDCCAEQRTYEKFYGLLSQRFCQINRTYVEPFQQIFKDTYSTTHRLDANRLRNVSKFFAHLLFTDAISWEVLDIMKMNEEDTNSSSRIFIKILCQELAEYMGLAKLNQRLKDETLRPYFAGLFPRDNPKNTRFSINFFTSIGLGGLTDELREHLKNLPKNLPVDDKEESSSSSDDSSSSSSDSDSDSSEEEEEEEKPKRKEKQKPEKSRARDEDRRRQERSPQTSHRGRNDRDNRRRDRRNQSSEKEDKTREKPRRNRDRDENRNDSRGKRDYEWVKSRYEDNIDQLRDKRRDFERDQVRVKEEKHRTKSRERVKVDSGRNRRERDRRRS